MTRDQLVCAFNEWQARFTENPAAFEAEFLMVERFKAELNEGETPSYGETCVTYLERLVQEKNA